MTQHVMSMVLMCLITFAAPALAQHPVQANVEDLAWMTGVWSGPMGKQTLEENWIQPSAGTMAAVIRFTDAEQTSMVELILIEEVKDTLVFRVRQWFPGYVPRQAEPQVMTLAEISDRRVSFVGDGSGDFKRLTYSRPENDNFNIDVETTGGDRFQLKLRAQ